MFGFDTLDLREEMERAQGRARPRADAPAAAAASPAPLALTASSIHYKKHLGAAAAALGFRADELTSRKPHTARGTGKNKGGRDHQTADANAAKAASEKVEDRIEATTGVRSELGEYLKQKAKQNEAAAVRAEKQHDQRAQQAQAAIDRYRAADDAEKDWLAHLASQDAQWVAEQTRRGNKWRRAPEGKRLKDLKKQAEAKQWPMAWKPEYARDIYEE